MDPQQWNRTGQPIKKPIGSIKIPGDVDVWPHEYRTAVALSRAGFNVTFIKKSDENREKTLGRYVFYLPRALFMSRQA